jgi:hypothetical protein
LLQLVAYVRELEAAGKIRTEAQFMFREWASKKNWATTLKTLAKQMKIQETVARVVSKLGDQINEKVVYKFSWTNANIERWADIAKETPHTKAGQGRASHFAWLCQQEIAAR